MSNRKLNSDPTVNMRLLLFVVLTTGALASADQSIHGHHHRRHVLAAWRAHVAPRADASGGDTSRQAGRLAEERQRQRDALSRDRRATVSAYNFEGEFGCGGRV